MELMSHTPWVGASPRLRTLAGVWVSPRVPQPSWWLSGDTWGLDAQQTAAVNIHTCVPAVNPPQRGR